MQFHNIDTLPPKIDPTVTAKQARLRYISIPFPGYAREKKEKGFIYRDDKGQPIKDPEILARIKKLVIPPAWSKVWICPLPNGHLQATGFDEKGRKQYLYHKTWMHICQQTKFNKMHFFATVLPTIREAIDKGMHEKGLTQRRVLATVLWLLDNTYLRIGNTEYSKENNSFGLTTLRMKHVSIENEQTIRFSFKGKSGIFHDVQVSHPRVARTIRKLEELPGYELFQYIDDEGKRHSVDSSEVNAYLHQITGDVVTAKDFRTWGGTVLAGTSLYELGDFSTKTQGKKNMTQAVKRVAKHLRNTPATSRTYYIHPTILTTYEKQLLIPHFDAVKKEMKKLEIEGLTPEEVAIQTLLQRYTKKT